MINLLNWLFCHELWRISLSFKTTKIYHMVLQIKSLYNFTSYMLTSYVTWHVINSFFYEIPLTYHESSFWNFAKAIRIFFNINKGFSYFFLHAREWIQIVYVWFFFLFYSSGFFGLHCNKPCLEGSGCFGRIRIFSPNCQWYLWQMNNE